MYRSRSFLALLAAAALALAGCGRGETGTLAGNETAPSEAGSAGSETPETAPSSEEPAPTAVPTDSTPEEATDGTDYEACYDGSCEVVVTEGVEIAFAPEFDVDKLVVIDIAEDYVSLSSGFGGIGTGPGGCAGVNGLGFTVGSADGDEAVITFYPAIDCF